MLINILSNYQVSTAFKEKIEGGGLNWFTRSSKLVKTLCERWQCIDCFKSLHRMDLFFCLMSTLSLCLASPVGFNAPPPSVYLPSLTLKFKITPQCLLPTHKQRPCTAGWDYNTVTTKWLQINPNPWFDSNRPLVFDLIANIWPQPTGHYTPVRPIAKPNPESGVPSLINQWPRRIIKHGRQSNLTMDHLQYPEIKLW